MALNPTPEVLAALRDAASQTNVPLSLLWGVAFAESGFDPAAVGKPTASGERALGLMQLMPATAAANGVTDPMNAAQSALGGARLLAELGKALQWDVPKMLAAYNWGAGNVRRTAVPAEVATYVRRALAAREVYRGKASRPEGSIMVATNAAIEALAALNPQWAPAIVARDGWRKFFASGARDASDAAALINPTLQGHWRNYAAAYERAPLTDESTPAPALIEPDRWLAAAKAVDAIKKKVGDAALGIGGGLFLLAVFAFAVSSSRRR